MIEIVNLGGYATIQGCERTGVRKYGIPKGGFMDIGSAALANTSLGNDPCAALIELFGGHLTFLCKSKMLVAITGASTTATVGQNVYPCPAVFPVEQGSKVVIEGLDNGNILYIGVKSGFDVTKSFGSSSTYVTTGIGPNNGKRLQRGDRVKVFDQISPQPELTKKLHGEHFAKNQSVTVFKGPEFDYLTEEAKKSLFRESFQVAQVSRMGYRLEGNQLFTHDGPPLTSRFVTRGTIQLPPSGNPIVLMSDSQTTGGYPRIAQIMKKDIDFFSQLKPRSRSRFRIQESIY